MAMNFETDIVITNSYTVSRGRKANTTVGTGSFAFGNEVTASGIYSHAEGFNTAATGSYSHAEGGGTTARVYSHAEGYMTKATGDCSHSEGQYTTAQRKSQHVSGEYNVPDTTGATSTRGDYVEIIGNGTSTASLSNARALDWNGNERLAGDLYVNCNDDSTGGTKVVTTPMAGATSSAAGATGLVPAPSAGDQLKFLRGDRTWHAEGDRGRASGSSIGEGSWAFGDNVEANGAYSHVEGIGTKAQYSAMHVSGKYNSTSVEMLPYWEAGKYYNVGDSVLISLGDGVYATQTCIVANNDATYDSSHWSFFDGFAEIIGNGTANNARSNARLLDWKGNEYLKGDLYINCNANSAGGTNISNMLLTSSEAFSIPAVGTPVLYDMEGITENHELIRWNFSQSPENAPPVSLTWETYNGYFMITNSAGTTDETIKPVFALAKSVTITQHTEEEE